MKVVHFGKFYPPYRGGMESFLATLCKGLVKKGIECEVLVAHNGKNNELSKDDGVRVLRMRSFGTFKSQPLCPGAPMALCGRGADIVNLHHPNPLAELSYFISRPQGHLVVTYHSDIVNQTCLSTIHAPLLHWVLDKAEAIVATSYDYVASSPILPRYREKIRVIPLGCEVPFDGLAKFSKLAKEKRPEPQYLFVGRLVPYKGLPVLLEAMQYAPGRLWIAGTGPREEMLRAQAARLDLKDRVEFLGDVTEAEKFRRLADCDVFVLPSISRAEAFGLVLLEAMAMKRPVVASDLPTGVRMLVQHGVNGFRFPPGDVHALSAALKALALNPQTARNMGERGWHLAQQTYTTQLMVSRYHRLYEELYHSKS